MNFGMLGDEEMGLWISFRKLGGSKEGLRHLSAREIGKRRKENR